MKQNSIRRVTYIDVLRILATFAVIFLHVSSTGFQDVTAFQNRNWYIAAMDDSLVRWAVPIFVMISGALFLNPRKDVTIKNILSKRLPRLLITYIFWWIFYSSVNYFYFGIRNINDWIQPYFHLWFLPMLMCIYLLIPLLRKIVADEKVLQYSLIIWLGYILISFMFKTFETSHEIRQIWNLFCCDKIIGYCGYFLLGYYLSTTTLNKRVRHIIYVLGLLGAISTVAGNIIMTFMDGIATDKFMNNLSLRVIMMASALFVGIKYNVYRIEPFVYKTITYLKKDLFGIYLIHAFYLIIFNRDVFRDICSHAVTVPIISIVIFIASLYTTKIIRLIPLLRKTVE